MKRRCQIRITQAACVSLGLRRASPSRPFFPPRPGPCVLGLRADEQLLPVTPEVAASQGSARGAF